LARNTALWLKGTYELFYLFWGGHRAFALEGWL
jgi:hypothetical protein